MCNNLLLIQHQNTYYTAAYTVDSSLEPLIPATLPADVMKICIHFTLNNAPLLEDSYNMLVGRMIQKIASMVLWSSLGYDVTVLGLENGDSVLQLTCHIKPAVEAQGAPDTRIIPLLKQVNVVFGIYSNDAISVENIQAGVYYLLLSLLLHWEHRFPLVFSVYGRKFFRLNYGISIRTTDEILRFEQSFYNRSDYDRSTMLATVVTRLGKYSQMHLTTTNMWKTFNFKSKIKTLKANTEKSLKSILHTVYLLEW